ncbi:transmembrane protein, putative (macronuclear) [Tetrahymena thermophila SB210]|uniref:Transmembrane protein, putative n=1 Tax=Tetrahymena thermophila (strain SB210) TaxID=312017 RepID=Q232V5_TETTS|nr:transmembrane protein, putative [Tetrahymena thermophila SB210]EAR91725.2 transmembrane protein, putative [Tetrahymena thermophila SB210]|eukprot:XP_001011970.2 transmembrane protein, putative [Tetrahymena thermophila SB210]
MKRRAPSISNVANLNQYSNQILSFIEMFFYVFSTVTIVITMVDLLQQNNKYLYYGVTIFVLYMLQGFYGFINQDLDKIHSPKFSLFLKLFFLEHFSLIYTRRNSLNNQISNEIYSSATSSSFFQGRILSVVCIYLLSFYGLQSNNLDIIYQLSIAATSLNVGLYNPQFFMREDTCPEDLFHYTIEVYSRSAFYSVLFLVQKDDGDYHYQTTQTIIDFFITFLIIGFSITVLQLLYNLIIKRLPVLDSFVGSGHLFINCIYLRYPSNIAVQKHKLLFMKNSSYVINPQIVVLSALHRLAECFGFFYMYYKYLDLSPNQSSAINTQIRISQVSSAIYTYILSFQILYVIVAACTNLRDSADINETTIINGAATTSKSPEQTKNNGLTTRCQQISINNKDNSNDNTLVPIYENDRTDKGTKETQRVITQFNNNSNNVTNNTEKIPKIKNNQKKLSMFGQISVQGNSPTSTDNGTFIFQQDFEENQGFQALKIFSPIITKKVNFSLQQIS